MDNPGQVIVPSHPVACPRCRYDLRAAPAEWIDACPLEGRCPECGLSLRWSAMLGVSREPPAWLFEYAPGRRLGQAWLRTILATLLAFPLWRRLEMHMPWRPWRLLLMVAGVPVAILLLIALANLAVAGSTWWSFTRVKPISHTRFIGPNMPLPPGVGSGSAQSPPGPPSLLTVLGEALLTPLAGSSRATVAVNGVAVPYAAPVSVTTSLGDRSVPLTHHWFSWLGPWRFSEQGLGQTPSPGWTIDPTGFRSRVGPSTPIQGLAHLARGLFTRHGAAIAAAVLLQTLLVPAIFAFLPQTRRKCKVRWEHIVRASLYSLVPMLLLLGALPLRAYLLAQFSPGGGHQVSGVLATMSILPALLLFLWWSLTIRLYLRMPHAPGIAATATTIALILSWLCFPKSALIPLVDF